ncbi:hypothetical protein PR048_025073 [Dryococelus australis]|uniref:Uncharacterized protein n=1 Tax=Dryococelus australis TaxID=614101 RepID=A0ABQ9GQB2_9NEOP|nr:hypothetical protein PR048_025073 [Dryococelus australis]
MRHTPPPRTATNKLGELPFINNRSSGTPAYLESDARFELLGILETTGKIPPVLPISDTTLEGICGIRVIFWQHATIEIQRNTSHARSHPRLSTPTIACSDRPVHNGGHATKRRARKISPERKEVPEVVTVAAPVEWTKSYTTLELAVRGRRPDALFMPLASVRRLTQGLTLQHGSNAVRNHYRKFLLDAYYSPRQTRTAVSSQPECAYSRAVAFTRLISRPLVHSHHEHLVAISSQPYLTSLPYSARWPLPDARLLAQKLIYISHCAECPSLPEYSCPSSTLVGFFSRGRRKAIDHSPATPLGESEGERFCLGREGGTRCVATPPPPSQEPDRVGGPKVWRNARFLASALREPVAQNYAQQSSEYQLLRRTGEKLTIRGFNQPSGQCASEPDPMAVVFADRAETEIALMCLSTDSMIRPLPEVCFLFQCGYRGPRWGSGQTTRLPPRRTGFDSLRGRSIILACGIVPDDTAGRQVFWEISRFLCTCIPALLHYSTRFTLSALDTSINRRKFIKQFSFPDRRQLIGRICHRAARSEILMTGQCKREVHLHVAPTRPALRGVAWEENCVEAENEGLEWSQLLAAKEGVRNPPPPLLRPSLESKTLGRQLSYRNRSGSADSSTITAMHTGSVNSSSILIHPADTTPHSLHKDLCSDQIQQIPGGVAPGFRHVRIVPGDATSRWVYSEISRFYAISFRRSSVPASPRPHTLKTSLLRTAQTSPPLPIPAYETQLEAKNVQQNAHRKREATSVLAVQKVAPVEREEGSGATRPETPEDTAGNTRSLPTRRSTYLRRTFVTMRCTLFSAYRNNHWRYPSRRAGQKVQKKESGRRECEKGTRSDNGLLITRLLCMFSAYHKSQLTSKGQRPEEGRCDCVGDLRF